MENNSDKEMRDKLRGVEQPFDPKAWEQMEAMLEKDRKPKAFIWWWMGGVAACLMLGAGIFGYQQFSTHQRSGTELSVNSQKQTTGVTNSESQPSVAANGRNSAPVVENGGTVSSKNRLPNIETKTNSENTKPSIKHQANAIEKKLNRHNYAVAKPIKHPASVAPKSSDSQKTHNGKDPKKAEGKLHENRARKQQGYPSNATAGGQSGTAELSVSNNGTLINELLAAANAQPTPAADNMLMMGPDALTTTATMDDEMKKKERDDIDLKKLKKKLQFNCSLGAAANITGTTLGDQGAGTGSLFYKKPSYMVGITEDFMFIKRIAITSGLLFSQTSYEVFSPQTAMCNITELNIPIGLKGYLISKNKVRFYICAGIINHIKLKETFTYAQVYNLANALGGSIPATVDNMFSGQSQSTSRTYSINNAKRYYASFYATAGTEFIVKKHMVFFAEPLFYMGLEKVGAENKHKYNLGLSGGLRYQF